MIFNLSFHPIPPSCPLQGFAHFAYLSLGSLLQTKAAKSMSLPCFPVDQYNCSFSHLAPQISQVRQDIGLPRNKVFPHLPHLAGYLPK
jgi:hypothetical protein